MADLIVLWCQSLLIYNINSSKQTYGAPLANTQQRISLFVKFDIHTIAYTVWAVE
jgi:hypothetical protein